MKHDYDTLPQRGVTAEMVDDNFYAIKEDINALLRWELDGKLI